MLRFILLYLALVACSGCASPSLCVRDEAAAAQLHKIILPSVTFEGEMSDVMDYMSMACRIIGPFAVHVHQEIRGDFMVYSFPVETPVEDTGYNAPPSIRMGPAIKFSATKISTLDLLRKVVELSGGSGEVRKGFVIVKTRRCQPPKLTEKPAGASGTF